MRLDELFANFADPPADARVTPFFWWSGGDLDRETLSWHLDQLAEQGIGGTIVGYSHLPDGSVDHGSPEPYSDDWWNLFTWFVDASAARGMSVGIQDYCFFGPALRRAGARTGGLNAGSLGHELRVVRGPARLEMVGPGTIVSALAWHEDRGLDDAVIVPATGSAVEWEVPAGTWTVSIVTLNAKQIGIHASEFDPLHPDSGAAIIDGYYREFEVHLEGRLGAALTVFFQDELDFGMVMPMWNDRVASALTSKGFHPGIAVHSLWVDSADSLTVREAYRTIVRDLLEESYFRPIYEWHERHGTRLIMDQISRGDLRLGHRHYADFLQTMKWYHGPGNDDPDLSGPRNLAAFRVSASIARVHDRPLVANEAFHSSTWGVTPAQIAAGADVGFAAGANMLILHGLNFTTNGGWWEWASPDFHFRQPWWRDSGPLWTYLARISGILRQGVAVSNVCIIDPTPDLDRVGLTARSPELARQVLTALCAAGIPADVVSPDLIAATPEPRLVAGSASYRAAIILSECLPESARATMDSFRAAGGTAISALDVDDVSSLVDVVDAMQIAAIRFEQSGLMVAHRRLGDFDVFFVTNPTPLPVATRVGLGEAGTAELWDAWSLERAPFRGGRADFSGSDTLMLESGRSTVIVVDRGEPAGTGTTATEIVARKELLLGPSETELCPTLDDRYGDFDLLPESTGVESWFYEVGQGPQGPWRRQQHGVAPRFLALGPCSPGVAERIETELVGAAQQGAAPAADLGAWREYQFSESYGIPDDPMQRDRMTGPHGLKGVPSAFLDVRALDDDAPPGSVYFFWSTVSGPPGAEVVRLRSRSASKVWVDGVLCAELAAAPVVRFPPWDLLDRSSVLSEGKVSVHAVSTVLLRVDVSDGQPTRVAVAVGGHDRPDLGKRRLGWWDGEHRSRRFALPGATRDPSKWMRLAAPPGVHELRLRTDARVVHATNDDRDLIVERDERRGEWVFTPLTVGSRLVIGLVPAESQTDVDVAVPQWSPGATSGPESWWESDSLSTYSGAILHRSTFALDSLGGEQVYVALQSLDGACSVRINGAHAGTILSPNDPLNITRFVVLGLNHLELVVTNTLANHYRRVPTPYGAPNRGGAAGIRVSVTHPR